MKPNKHTALAGSIALALLASVSLSHGQLPVSRQTINSPVALTGAASTQVGVPVMQAPVARDIVAAVAGQDIAGTTGGYAIYPANSHMALIKTGAGYGKGLTIASNTASVLTVVGTVPALTVGSDEFEIVPLPTIASVFGSPTSSAPLDLAGSSGAATADKVIIGGVQYFYKSSGANAPGWKLTSAPSAVGDLGSTPIPNLQGVFVTRVGAGTTVNVRGVAREGRAVIEIPTGATNLSWAFPQETSLLNSKLQNSITGSSGAATADKVIIGGLQYFYKTSGANSPGWKLTTAPNAAAPGADNVVINPGGKAFFIQRLGAATSHPAEESYTP
jgi:hypothetical protein